MMIQCPNCSATYEIADSGAVNGRKVRCTRCQVVWRAEVIASAKADTEPALAGAVPAAPLPPAAAVVANAMPAGQSAMVAHSDLGEADDTDTDDNLGGHYEDSAPGTGESGPAVFAHSNEVPSDSYVEPSEADYDDQSSGEDRDAADHAAGDHAGDDDDAQHGISQGGDEPESAPPQLNGSAHRNGSGNGAKPSGLSTGRGVYASTVGDFDQGSEMPKPAARGSLDGGFNDEFWRAGAAGKIEPSFGPPAGAVAGKVPRAAKVTRRGRRPAAAREPNLDDQLIPADAENERPDYSATAMDPLPPRRPSRALVMLGWLALIGVIGAGAASAVLAPPFVARNVPGGAALYQAAGIALNTRGFEFDKIEYTWVHDEKGRPAMEVNGEVKNITGLSKKVPSVVFAFLDEEGLELFNWATPVKLSALGAGKTAHFEVKIPAPPEAVDRLELRFATVLD